MTQETTGESSRVSESAKVKDWANASKLIGTEPQDFGLILLYLYQNFSIPY